MAITLLAAVQEFSSRRGLPRPLVAALSKDDLTLQIVALANEICEILGRYAWTTLQYSTTFTSVASEDQGLIDTLAPMGCKKILNETIWDRTQRLRVFGPRSPSEWEQLKALPMSGPLYQYRIQNGYLKVLPVMVAGHTMAFEYLSRYLISDPTATPTTGKARFTKDTDEFLLDETLLIQGLRWIWNKEKGFAYAEEKQMWEQSVSVAKSGDGTKPTLNLSTDTRGLTPGIWVPAGSWNIP